jgi:hypothetical protein
LIACQAENKAFYLVLNSSTVQLDSLRACKKRGSGVSSPSEQLFHKFMEQLKEILENIPKPLEWRSFYNNDLPILMDINEEVRKFDDRDIVGLYEKS